MAKKGPLLVNNVQGTADSGQRTSASVAITLTEGCTGCTWLIRSHLSATLMWKFEHNVKHNNTILEFPITNMNQL